ncbi:ABC-ATPase domain-containing protein, partial [Staphylococcus epidermidis]|uniref:ABC-ATPase domain-containing protein n=1 Tax=Staphylococcus epidermidis TaxID=1282 RepID=UPI001C92C808
NAIQFKSPKQYDIVIKLSTRKVINPIPIPKPITLILPRRYHPKSTLLQPLQPPLYNHIPRHGTQYLITNQHPIKIPPQHPTTIQNVNIHPFIHHFPPQR